MTALEIWETYGNAWSEPNEVIRNQTLSIYLTTDCIYTDPNVEIAGINALSDYMHEFQKAFPGARFVVIDFKVHHDQSLAHWNMVDVQGNIMSRGASFGIYNNYKLLKMTGFFWEL